MSVPPAQNPVVVTEDKTVAILAYLTLIGFIVALVLHTSAGKKTSLGAYHLRQALGLLISALALHLLRLFVLSHIWVLGWMAGAGLWCVLAVIWIIGLIHAANGRRKPVPLLGPLYEQYLGNLFE